MGLAFLFLLKFTLTQASPWGWCSQWVACIGAFAHLFLPSPQRPYGEVYELEVDTLETTCHALDPTALANCSVRQLTEHVSATLWWVGGTWPPQFSQEQFGFIQLQAAILASQRAISKTAVGWCLL